MEKHRFGRTDLEVSRLTFGCGAVGGLMTRGNAKRLRIDHVDLFQLHNTIGEPDRHGTITADQVLNEVIPAFEKLRDAGKTRYLGFTAKGDTEQLLQLVQSDKFDSAQIFYNLLVPTAGEPVVGDYPSQDYKELLNVAEAHGVGAIGVRVLAGGALSGSESRHPLGMPQVAPIGSDTDYATDVRRSLLFSPLVEDGIAGSLPELAVRYVISNPTLPTTEIGIANLEQLQLAAAAINLGPLDEQALARVKLIQASLKAHG